MRKDNSCKIALFMLTFGITIGYFLARLMDKLDCHIICFHGKCDSNLPSDCVCIEHPDSECNCNDDTNKPEPYVEPLQKSDNDGCTC